MAIFFLHRIQKDDGNFVKGIEAHVTMDDAIRSFWGRVKTGYNNPDHPAMTFVSCYITDDNGIVYKRYFDTWLKPADPEAEDPEPVENKYFLHSIRRDGETITKAIDVFDTMDDAKRAYAAAMEYGYNNPKFPGVNLVTCEITDMMSGSKILSSDNWVKTQA